MKKWSALASLVLAAAVFAGPGAGTTVGTGTQAATQLRKASAYPCYFINNPFTCALKSGGQCTWQDGHCVPAS